MKFCFYHGRVNFLLKYIAGRAALSMTGALPPNPDISLYDRGR